MAPCGSRSTARSTTTRRFAHRSKQRVIATRRAVTRRPSFISTRKAGMPAWIGCKACSPLPSGMAPASGYWRLPVPALDDDGASLAERAAELRARLRATVRSHLMSDVPLGLFLSGGLDSSGIAALMAPLADRAIRTFSVGFSDPEANELAFARRAAQAVGAEHFEIVVSPEQFFAALPTLVWHEDEPIAFTSSVPLYFVSRLAQQQVKVVLTGEGADELFLGYNWYPVTAWNDRLARAYSRLTPNGLRRRIQRSIP